MKCISLWQPWASLMALDLKKNETRSWPTKYRGPLAIHAAKRRMCDVGIDLMFRCGVASVVQEAYPRNVPYGAIVCTLELYDCQEVTNENVPSSPERDFGDYMVGGLNKRFMWLTRNVRMLDNPIPWRGSQGFFDVPDELFAEPTSLERTGT